MPLSISSTLTCTQRPSNYASVIFYLKGAMCSNIVQDANKIFNTRIDIKDHQVSD